MRWLTRTAAAVVLLLSAALSDARAQGAVKAEPPPLPTSAASSSAKPLTFSRDIAPVIWRRCAPCHRPSQAGPFNLLTYADVKQRASLIAEVTAKRIMPPWPAEPIAAPYEGERRLTDHELQNLQRWLAEGASEGDPSELPAQPRWPEGWSLGEPDLVVSMVRPYTIPPEGRDLYRHFVIPVPTTERRFVRAVELRPGNTRVVHHGFMFVDETGASKPLDEQVAQPGPPPGARMPEGQFLSYQPGRGPAMAPAGMPWALAPNSYYLLQLHLKPSGKSESLQASVGFYFTNQPPATTPFKIGLTSLTIDIPAGESNYVITDSFVLPIDTRVLAVMPHAHYLAKEIKGFAARPDGTTVPLIHIKRWDFDWQGDYRFSEPVFLAKGSTLRMEFSYDNSSANPRNPHSPPKPVLYGEQTTDEMGELWLQLLVSNPNDRAVLGREYALKNDRVHLARADFLLAKNPRDPKGHFTRALVLLNQRKTAEAIQHLELATSANPDHQEAYFTLGVVHLRNRNLDGAEAAFKNAVRLNPNDYRAQGSLGNVYLGKGRLDEAAVQFENALRINPQDATAKENLDRIKRARRP